MPNLEDVCHSLLLLAHVRLCMKNITKRVPICEHPYASPRAQHHKGKNSHSTTSTKGQAPKGNGKNHKQAPQQTQ